MQLLDVGSRLGERVDERRPAAEAAAVQPAAQLALLPAGERGDARRVVRVALHQRERLQHRVVDPRRDLGALLRGGSARCARTASCHSQGPKTSRSAPPTAPGAMSELDAPTWPRRITAPAIISAIPSRGSEPPGRSEPPRARTTARPATSRPAPRTRRLPRARARTGRRRRRRRTAARPTQRRPAAAVDPEREVEEDPGAAREREQREDEPHEGRVDGERRRDPAADAREHAVVLAAPERQGGSLGHLARTTSIRPAPTLASITNRPAADVDAGVPAVVVAAEHVDLADLGVRVDLDVGVPGDDDSQLADADAGPSMRCVAGRFELREVDLAGFRSPSVVGRTGRPPIEVGPVGAVADAVAEAHVEPGEGGDDRDDRRDRERTLASAATRDQDAAGRPLPAARPEDREPADQDDDPARAGGDLAAREQEHERDAGEPEADERPRPLAPLGEDLGGDRLLLALAGMTSTAAR